MNCGITFTKAPIKGSRRGEIVLEFVVCEALMTKSVFYSAFAMKVTTTFLAS